MGKRNSGNAGTRRVHMAVKEALAARRSVSWRLSIYVSLLVPLAQGEWGLCVPVKTRRIVKALHHLVERPSYTRSVSLL